MSSINVVYGTLINRTSRQKPKLWTIRSLVRSSNNSKHCSGRTHHMSTIASSPPEFKLYNSLAGAVETIPIQTQDGRGIACYTCGPTVYDATHLGHARTFVWLDIFRRCLERVASSSSSSSPGSVVPPPLFVMNITNVDDKILAAAEANQTSPLEWAAHWEQDFWNDFDALNCLRPHVVTRVTEHVESDIIPYIQRILESGCAYQGSDGSVYFNVKFYEDKMQHVTRYGKLAPPRSATDFYSTSASPITALPGGKKDHRDFALWKSRKQEERMYWESPWGEGRPGWHIECSGMIEAVQKQFADTHLFRIHTGGIDLKFPHHTNEIAQAEAYHSDFILSQTKQQTEFWIPHWIHTGHLHIDGLKMSKSLKNFITVKELLSDDGGCSADDFRLWCLGLSGSYRNAATYSKESIANAKSIREKIVQFLIDGETWLLKNGKDSGRKKWEAREKELYNTVLQTVNHAQQAILNDLDGGTFVNNIVALAEVGRSYLDGKEHEVNAEAITFAMHHVRKSMESVGFSEATCRAGRISMIQASSSHAAGGETSLLNELVRFRSKIRRAAIADIKAGTANSNTREILRICDEAREHVFPRIGVELLDGKVDDQDDGDGSSWRFCIPQQCTLQSSGSTQKKQPKLGTIPIEDFFRVGAYEGVFLEFTDEGIPLKNADGSDISNRLMKKLLKRREKYAEKVAKDENTKVNKC